MTALGVHIEYKRRGGVARDSGPGDTLRLLHGIASWARTTGITNVDILTTSPARCAGLVVPGVAVRWLAVDKTLLQDRRLGTLLQQGVTNGITLGNYTHVIHAYVSPCRQASVVCGLPRIQVDVPAVLSGTLAPLVPAGAGGAAKRTLAVALRCLQNRRERGTPKGLPQAVRKWVRAHVATSGPPWEILWYGVASRRDLDIPLNVKSGESLYEYGNDSYLTQLTRLRDADLAVGVNSGGLDMAAAAGVPVLRLGTFHPAAWGGSSAYNDYLACRTNVTIECATPKLHLYALRPWLSAMMAAARSSHVMKARHIVVLPGAAPCL